MRTTGVSNIPLNPRDGYVNAFWATIASGTATGDYAWTWAGYGPTPPVESGTIFVNPAREVNGSQWVPTDAVVMLVADELPVTNDTILRFFYPVNEPS